MNQWKELYEKKKMTVQEVAKHVKSGDVCACPAALQEPYAICDAVAERAKAGEISGVVHHSTLSATGGGYLDPELDGKYNYVSWFTSGSARKSVQSGANTYMPTAFGMHPYHWRHTQERLDVLYTEVAPMDEHGYFTCGLASAELVAMKERASKILVQVNEKMPRTYGICTIHISEVTAICEHSHDISQLINPEITETDKIIGAMIANEVKDGSTLQLGIGGVPNAVGILLQEKKDLGIHTEMFTDSMVDLMLSGAVNNSKKPVNKGVSISTLAWGSQKMYDFIHENRAFELHPVDYTNDSYLMGQHDNFISVNSCIEIDLFGQVCSESIGTKHFSGSGGQLDFVRGANMSKGGKGFIAMYRQQKVV
ncbi:MAG: acetyl-CoA hydrolase/transferase C-terminal domain-containing protein, partial [Bacillota bacterium]